MADAKVRRRGTKPAPPHQQDPAAGIDDDDGGRNAPALTIKWSKLAVLAVLVLSPYFLLLWFLPIDAGLMRSILTNLAMSVAGFAGVILLIPVASTSVLRRNMFGYDINKRGSPAGKVKVPESLGLVTGIVFLVVTILFQHFIFSSENNISDQYPPENAVCDYFQPFLRWICASLKLRIAHLDASRTSILFQLDQLLVTIVRAASWIIFTWKWLTEYYAALASICFMLFLGFVDDVLDLPWRVKLFLPSIAALPLLMAYAGRTVIVVPKPLRSALGFTELDLGWVYKLYMGLVAVFCTNSINILAGVNGLEVGQTVIISCAVLVHNVMQISRSDETRQAHAFSLYLMQPLVATSLGLLAFNWYPSSVFVGDTYTYFAGMALAVVGILGHFSETLLLFFLPQILNFLYSIPQLFKIVPCPRHRLPSYDPRTGLLTGSNDMNLVNLFLRWFGRCSEQQLCIRLLAFQVLACGFCFGLRYLMAGWYK